MRLPRSLPLLVVFTAACAIVPAPVLARTFRAEHYGVSIRVMPGGSLEVTEHVTFRFDEGPFTRVFREVPTRRTDGILGVTVSLDGRILARGDAAGLFSLGRGEKSRARVVWHLPPTEHATHAFTLTNASGSSAGSDKPSVDPADAAAIRDGLPAVVKEAKAKGAP